MDRTSNMALLGGGDCCSDEEDSLDIHRLDDDLNVDILNGHASDDLVTEITVIDGTRVRDPLDFHSTDEAMNGIESETEFGLHVSLSGKSGDHNTEVLDDPVIDSDINGPGTNDVSGSKKQKGVKVKKMCGKGFRVGSVGSFTPGAGEDAYDHIAPDCVTKVRKWEKKKVQIKTLEGEFSVFIWVTGE